MKYEIIKKEGNTVTAQMIIESEDFKAFVDKAYKKTKGKFNVPGFRKGKAPKKMIETHYGEGVFFEEAIDLALRENYGNLLDELKLDVVDRPDVDIKEIKDGAVLEISVDVKPEFDIEGYKGVEVENIVHEVTDEDVEEEIKMVLDRHSRLVDVEDGTVELSDTVNIDFKGLLDGEAFEGGSMEGHNLKIGSNSFIPGFEEGLIGKKSGEEVNIDVTFPEEYHEESLAGKPVVFEVKINSIQRKELPTLDDEFVGDISEFETVDEYKEDLKKVMIEQAENADKAALRDKIVEKVVELADFDMPNGLVESETDRMVNEFDYQLRSQGLGLSDFLKMSSSTIEDFRSEVRETAEARAKSALVLAKVAELENISCSDEELDEELSKYAKDSSMELEEFKKAVNSYALDEIRDSIEVRKVIDLLVDNAKLV